MTPFHYIPKKVFLLRMARISIFVFFIGFVLMGAMANNEQVNLGPIDMAGYEFSRLPWVLTHPPAVCVSGDFVSEFQKERCGDYQMEVALTAFWVFFPFLFAGLFLRVALSRLISVYQKAGKALQSGKGLFIGRVTHPAEMPNDLFGWAFCLRSITVELGRNKQLRVYLPESMDVPEPGVELAICDLGRHFTRSRYMAAPYTPHVAVVRG
ncbi:MAG TPA: hypothetical protein DCS07_07445 [Bdellovibrionales bacterium]|nr:MAG: hypothetical protein A2X97_09780 [Bdellovibrionales bacterium GWA1_52_35]HAR42453.1 hypothetical protein [Bdellovibrionales bacterium]HCM40444.1 hypothetical protein [Bdellovibrionales bacterium]